jgi:hypothetical protein
MSERESQALSGYFLSINLTTELSLVLRMVAERQA